MTVTRTERHGRWVVECSVCRDAITLQGTGAYFDEDERWFRGRHPDDPHEPSSAAQKGRK